MFSSSPESSAPASRRRVPRFCRFALLVVGALGAASLSPAAQVNLSWSDNSSNESGFKVERATGTSGSFAQIATTGANTRSYADRNVSTGSTYRYRVRAYNSAGNSSYSGIATVTVRSSSTSNTAPTISAISDRTINVNGSTGSIPFTIGDGQTDAWNLKITKSSSNTTLVPQKNMVFGGSAANRTIKVTPAANRTGSATISITVSDGSLSRTETFVVKVSGSGSGSASGSNTAPTISAISDRTINVNSSTGSIPFTIGDGQTDAWNLKITKSSSNTTLVPHKNMVFGGSAANRTIKVTPAANRTGSSTISITVSDGSLSRTETFVVKVSGSGSSSASGSNTAPTISAISDRTINVNGSTGSIPFTIGDAQTGAWNLKITKTASNPTLTPASGMVFGGSSANRTITIKPAPNRTGSSTISIKVSDGSLSRTETFVVTVKDSSGGGTASGSKFTNVAVGNPKLKGKTTIRSNGRVEIHAAGVSTKTKDQLRLAYTTLRGDSEMVVRVSSLTRTSPNSRAGLTYRASTAGNAAQVSVYVTADNGIHLVSRSSSGAETRVDGRMNGRAPEWLRLIRDGDMFYALMSEDGKEWDLVEFVKVNLPDTAIAGMMASSHNANEAITAVFDDFAIY